MPTSTENDGNRYSVPPELVLEVCDILQIEDDGHGDLASEILAIGTKFANGREVERFWGAPGEQRKAIRRLIQSAEDTLIALYSVAPEYLVALEPMLDVPSPPLGSEDLITRTRTSLIKLLEAANRFDKAYKPNIGAAVDIILEEAVRALITFLKSNGFEPPKGTPGREGQGPRLRNKEAEAIAKLLTGIDPQTQVRSIVNMIAAVRRGRKPSEPHLFKIWETARSGLDYWYAAHLRTRI